MINLELFKDDTEQFLLDNAVEFKDLTDKILYEIDPDGKILSDNTQKDMLLEELAVTISLDIIAELMGVEIDDLPPDPLDGYFNAVNIILVYLTLESLVSKGILTKDWKLNVELPPQPDR